MNYSFLSITLKLLASGFAGYACTQSPLAGAVFGSLAAVTVGWSEDILFKWWR
jgi:hypothetical protein